VIHPALAPVFDWCLISLGRCPKLYDVRLTAWAFIVKR